MKYLFPVIPLRTIPKIGCVYVVTFNDDLFYIGSTKNLRSRMYVFIDDFNKLKCNKNIHEKCHKMVSVEVLEAVDDETTLKTREDFYIQSNTGNKLILNRSPSAFSNKGIKWDFRDKKYKAGVYTVKPKTENTERYWYKINHYKNNILLATYKNLQDAANNTGLSMATISNRLNQGIPIRQGDIFKKAEKKDECKRYYPCAVQKKKVKILTYNNLRNDIDVHSVMHRYVAGSSLNKMAKELNTSVNTLKYKLLKLHHFDYKNKVICK